MTAPTSLTSTPSGTTPSPTHEVLNQSVERVGVDEYSSHLALQEAVAQFDAGWADAHLHRAGTLYGSADVKRWAVEANVHKPELVTHDRYGHRIDEVDFHPAWHELMQRTVALGVHAASWRDPQPGAHVARAATMLMAGQAEAGHQCPISMTHAIIPVLREQPDVAAVWEPLLLSLDYDFGLRPAADKRGALAGMGMTEKQGGSDVRANTTRAVPAAGGGYLLTGHKWFTSAPMCDVFLMLAQTDEGLSCFLVPRVLPGGSRNVLRIQRLKDKLGNHSNASSELEFDGTWAQLIGEPGRGVRTIIGMVNHTRLDCVLGAAGGMRAGVTEAIWHAAHRSAFGHRLIEQELMTSVLADLALESEAATWSALRLARTFDADATEHERLLGRLATPVLKYWTTKRGPNHAFESLECLGGNGYCENFPMARLYREAPLVSIWEGSGNVMCLDALRALQRSPESLDAFLDELELARGGDATYDRALDQLRTDLPGLVVAQRSARRLVERLAVTFQAGQLVRHAPAVVSGAFCASRLGAERHGEYGTLPDDVNSAAIVARHLPEVA